MPSLTQRNILQLSFTNKEVPWPDLDAIAEKTFWLAGDDGAGTPAESKEFDLQGKTRSVKSVKCYVALMVNSPRENLHVMFSLFVRWIVKMILE